jgi:hypothetical protein
MNESSSSGLLQNSIAILQKFGSPGVIIEQQIYTPRHQLQENLSLHFADADKADRAQNTEFFDNIDDILNLKATEEFTEKLKLNIVREYLQRRSRRISPLAQSLPFLLKMRTLLFASYW